MTFKEKWTVERVTTCDACGKGQAIIATGKDRAAVESELSRLAETARDASSGQYQAFGGDPLRSVNLCGPCGDRLLPPRLDAEG